MRITTRFFAGSREIVGKSGMEIEVDDGATVAGLLYQLQQDFPDLDLEGLLVAVNTEYVESHFKLKNGDEVAFLPPLSGG